MKKSVEKFNSNFFIKKKVLKKNLEKNKGVAIS